MRELREEMLAVAKEYARQFGEIIDMELEHFVGDDPTDMACFGDCYFFSLTEMRACVDHIEAYTKRYGSREAVGQEIRDWVDWWLEGCQSDPLTELVERRVTHQLRPNISLKAWLDGCPREGIHPWSGPDADYMRLQNDVATVQRLVGDFRGSRSLDNVLTNLQARLDIEAKRKAERDSEDWQRVMEGKAGQQFRKAVEEEERNN